MDNSYNYEEEKFSLINSKINSLEERNKILKDQIFLINKNIIELKENVLKKNLELKKEAEFLKEELKKTSKIIDIISSEFPKFAKKEDIEILYKYSKMFNPLELVTKKN
jgi:hypothetical protein